MNRGRLLVFEGLDGSGKSTQIARLAAALRRAGHDLVVTREPTAGPLGRRIREMARSGRAVPPEIELQWFMEDRREHVREVIAPALAGGTLVVMDRYYLSSVAYQGARGLDPDSILEECEAAFPIPDLVLLLEVDPKEGLARVRARNGGFEEIFEKLDFQEQVAARFRALDRDYVTRIDAGAGESVVTAAIVQCVRERLGLL